MVIGNVCQQWCNLGLDAVPPFWAVARKHGHHLPPAVTPLYVDGD